ncbi:MAG: amidohydrolase family protein, partial [Bacteroidota bacterium]|nr:amidohydrolase family protein [Bacteroidota bacterium]
LIPLVTSKPAQFLKLHDRKGSFKIGYDADITIWSPEENFIVKDSAIFHRHKITPYAKQQFWGAIHQTYVNGELVFVDGKIITKNCGKPILRNEPTLVSK